MVFSLETFLDSTTKFIEEFVQLLGQKAKKRDRKVKRKEEITFAGRPLEVKGELRRSEIYDYL